MQSRIQNGKNTYRKGDLWIAPCLSLTPKPKRDWKHGRGEPNKSNRYLELADVALGLAPVKHKTKRNA